MSTPDPQPGVSTADRALTARLIAGEDSAFSEIYSREKGTVYGFLLRLSGNASTAADLFQNVWLKLARTAPRLSPDSHLRGWLLTVARREYLSLRRAQAVDISRLLSLGQAAARHAALEQCSDEDPTLRDLHTALHRLSDRDRELLLVTAMEDLDPAQTASVLGLKPATYRKRLSRARAKLNHLLDGHSPSLSTQERTTP